MMKRIWLISFCAVCVLALSLTGCKPAGGGEAEEAARPSNAGGPGEAVNLQGDAAKGAEIFKAACVACHGDQGKGGVANPGSKDGSVPALNPIDSTMVSSDYKTFATNIDLFLEHGSTPESDAGKTPALSMLAFGDQKTLQPQDIANVIAYVISLNKK